MAINNNTTPMSEGENPNGTIGTRQFSSYAAQSISTEVSRHNYQQAVKNDSKMEELRKIVYRYVSGMAKEQKIQIITEYDDASLLQGGLSDRKLNALCTETLIVHLRPEDLQQLYADLRAKEKKLYGDIKQYEKLRSHGKRGPKLNTSSFEDIAKRLQGVRRPGKFKRYLKKESKGTRVPKSLLNAFKNLRKEILEILKELYDPVEIAALCQRMGIEFEDNTSQKVLFNAIANKTMLYAALVTGKVKKYSGAIIDPEPFKDILQYTSMAYLSGRPGLDMKTLAAEKKKVRDAMRSKTGDAIKANRKIAKKSKNAARSYSKTVITNPATGGTISIGSKLPSSDSVDDEGEQRILQTLERITDVENPALEALVNEYLSGQKLKSLIKKFDLYKIKAMIYEAYKRNKEQREKISNKLKAPSIFRTKRRTEILRNRLAGLSTTGSLTDEREAGKRDEDLDKIDDTKTGLKYIYTLLRKPDSIPNNYFDQMLTGVNKIIDILINNSGNTTNINSNPSKLKELLYAGLDLASYGASEEMQNLVPGKTKGAQPEQLRGSVIRQRAQSTRNRNQEAAVEINNTQAQSITALTYTQQAVYGSKIISNQSKKTYKLTSMMQAPIVPVYITNASLEGDKNSLLSYIEIIPKTISSIKDEIMTLERGLSNFTVAAPMGAGIMASPLLAGEAFTKTALDAAKKSVDAVFGSAVDSLQANTGATIQPKLATGGTISTIKEIPKLATGGKATSIFAKAKSTKPSTAAIVGDAPGKNIFSNGARPELVRSTGTLNVQPIHQASEDKPQKVVKMSAQERNSALATSISSHVIKYAHGVYDDSEEISNIGEAIKVYNVKPGIADDIDVNGEETSLIKLVANIYAGLAQSGASTVAISQTTSQILQLLPSLIPGSSPATTNIIETSTPNGINIPSEIDSILGGN